MERLFKKEKGENMFKLAYDAERDTFELALTCWWSLHSLLTWRKLMQAFSPTSVHVYASGPAGEFIRVREYFGELLNRSGGVQDSEYEAEGFKALRQLLFLTLSRPSSRCCADPPDVQILKLKHKNKNKMWSTDGLS
ncbi:hypothetical protein J3Q64DRAFT_1830636 [Phycomyces blakesleeanus]|uniref:Uncharacterized protein n=1 Tax=Phycomyces blakesleeanus TaxID=4837 RepID=A0ABR3BAU6_PHYBL